MPHTIEARLQALGLELPPPPRVPPGFKFSFAWTRVRGHRVYCAGHGPQAADGSFPGPCGKVPSEATLEEAQLAARLTAVRDAAGFGDAETPRPAFSVQAQAASTQRPGAEYRTKLIAQRARRVVAVVDVEPSLAQPG